MSIVTNVIRKLGISDSHMPNMDELEANLIREVPFNARLGGSKGWASPKDGQQFQRNQMVSRAFNESMARLPLAR